MYDFVLNYKNRNVHLLHVLKKRIILHLPYHHHPNRRYGNIYKRVR